MALSFPDTPSDGQVYSYGGSSWKYNASVPAWEFYDTGNLVDVSQLMVTGFNAGNLLVVSSTGTLVEITPGEIVTAAGSVGITDVSGLTTTGLGTGNLLVVSASGGLVEITPLEIMLSASSGVLVDLGEAAYLNVGPSTGYVAAGDHTHAAGSVTGLGAAALLDVGPSTGLVAAGDHTHDAGDIGVNIEDVTSDHWLTLEDNGKVLVAIPSVETPTIKIYCSPSLGTGYSAMVVQSPDGLAAGVVTVEAGTASGGVYANAYLDYRTLAGANAAATILAYKEDSFNVSGNLVGQPT